MRFGKSPGSASVDLNSSINTIGCPFERFYGVLISVYSTWSSD